MPRLKLSTLRPSSRCLGQVSTAPSQFPMPHPMLPTLRPSPRCPVQAPDASSESVTPRLKLATLHLSFRRHVQGRDASSSFTMRQRELGHSSGSLAEASSFRFVPPGLVAQACPLSHDSRKPPSPALILSDATEFAHQRPGHTCASASPVMMTSHRASTWWLSCSRRKGVPAPSLVLRHPRGPPGGGSGLYLGQPAGERKAVAGEITPPLTSREAENRGRLAEGAETGQVMEAEALRRNRPDLDDALAASREALRGEVSGKAYLSRLFSVDWKASCGNRERTLRGIETTASSLR
jgi:hypothetical protein